MSEKIIFKDDTDSLVERESFLYLINTKSGWGGKLVNGKLEGFLYQACNKIKHLEAQNKALKELLKRSKPIVYWATVMTKDIPKLIESEEQAAAALLGHNAKELLKDITKQALQEES